MVDANIDQQMEDILNVTGDDPLSDAYGDERLISGQVPMERNPDLKDLTNVGKDFYGKAISGTEDLTGQMDNIRSEEDYSRLFVYDYGDDRIQKEVIDKLPEDSGLKTYANIVGPQLFQTSMDLLQGTLGIVGSTTDGVEVGLKTIEKNFPEAYKVLSNNRSPSAAAASLSRDIIALLEVSEAAILPINPAIKAAKAVKPTKNLINRYGQLKATKELRDLKKPDGGELQQRSDSLVSNVRKSDKVERRKQATELVNNLSSKLETDIGILNAAKTPMSEIEIDRRKTYIQNIIQEELGGVSPDDLNRFKTGTENLKTIITYKSNRLERAFPSGAKINPEAEKGKTVLFNLNKKLNSIQESINNPNLDDELFAIAYNDMVEIDEMQVKLSPILSDMEIPKSKSSKDTRSIDDLFVDMEGFKNYSLGRKESEEFSDRLKYNQSILRSKLKDKEGSDVIGPLTKDLSTPESIDDINTYDLPLARDWDSNSKSYEKGLSTTSKPDKPLVFEGEKNYASAAEMQIDKIFSQAKKVGDDRVINLGRLENKLNSIPSDQLEYMGITNLINEYKRKGINEVKQSVLESRISKNRIRLVEDVRELDSNYDGTFKSIFNQAKKGTAPKFINFSFAGRGKAKGANGNITGSIEDYAQTVEPESDLVLHNETMDEWIFDGEVIEGGDYGEALRDAIFDGFDNRDLNVSGYKELFVSIDNKVKIRPRTQKERGANVVITQKGRVNRPDYLKKPSVSSEEVKQYNPDQDDLEFIDTFPSEDYALINPEYSYTDSMHTGRTENPLGWVRFYDDVDLGDSISRLFIDEKQSKMFQNVGKIKKIDSTDPISGMSRQKSNSLRKIEDSIEGIDPAEYGSDNLLQREVSKVFDENDSIDTTGMPKQIPNLPLRDKWAEILFKRMIKEAITNDKGGLAWVGGMKQIERFPKRMTMDSAGVPIEDFNTPLIDFYDEILPSIANKIAKKYGLKLEKKTHIMKLKRNNKLDKIETKHLLGALRQLTKNLNDPKQVYDLDNVMYKNKSLNEYLPKYRSGNVSINPTTGEGLPYPINSNVFKGDTNPYRVRQMSSQDLGGRVLSDLIQASDEALEANRENIIRNIEEMSGSPYDVWVLDFPDGNKIIEDFAGLDNNPIEFNKGGTIDKEMGQLFAN
tara:strand:+ start:166 stop:3615 length:3450 start_codon:yes stop_codon:yes gene_type:complete